MNHKYSSTCNCETCFVVWVAEAEVERAAAHERGEQRRQERAALWSQMIEHFEKRVTTTPTTEEER